MKTKYVVPSLKEEPIYWAILKNSAVEVFTSIHIERCWMNAEKEVFTAKLRVSYRNYYDATSISICY